MTLQIEWRASEEIREGIVIQTGRGGSLDIKLLGCFFRFNVKIVKMIYIVKKISRIGIIYHMK